MDVIDALYRPTTPEGTNKFLFGYDLFAYSQRLYEQRLLASLQGSPWNHSNAEINETIMAEHGACQHTVVRAEEAFQFSSSFNCHLIDSIKLKHSNA
jgi:hypothetical protein